MKTNAWKKLALILFLCLLTFDLLSQTFTEQTSIVLPGFSKGTTTWGDYDNDNDLDLLVSGVFDDNIMRIKIFRNNGDNTFHDVGDVFTPDIPENFNYWEDAISTKWADIDNDGYLDIIVELSNYRQELYIYGNSADGTFTERFNMFFLKYNGGSSSDFGDYDNDGDLDILLVTNITSKILANQGGFVFAEQYSVSLVNMTNSFSEWIDYDNDGDLDIFICGMEDYYKRISYIYRNSGNNVFNIQQDLTFPDAESKCDWGDYNGDSYPDLLLTGAGDTKIYKNNGNNTFTLKSIRLPGIRDGSGKWGDFDNDGDLDIILSGESNSVKITKIFLNYGENSFVEALGTNLFNIGESSIGAGDYDKDGDLDLVLAGVNGNVKSTKIYQNNCHVSNYPPGVPSGFSSVISGSDVVISWEEVNSDITVSKSLSYNIKIGSTPGGSDIVNSMSAFDGTRHIAEKGNCQFGTTFNLRNLKKGIYYYQIQAVDNCFLGGQFSSEASFTYDISFQAFGAICRNPGANTATLSWSRGNGSKCIVFMKEGLGGDAIPFDNTTYTPSSVFKDGSKIIGTEWYCVFSGSGTTVDVTGLTSNKEYLFQVLEYDGSAGSEIYNPQHSLLNSASFKTGNFTELKDLNLNTVSINSLENMQSATATWIDFDNDDDLDLFLRGNTASALYRNDLNGNFSLMPQTFSNGYSASFADYNLDGFIDILIGAAPAKLYKNNGNQTFSEQTEVGIPLTIACTAKWGDYDNDGDPDILVTGSFFGNGTRVSKIYRNDQGIMFTEQTSINIEGVQYFGNSSWIDYDNDDYLDLFINGSNNSGQSITKLYHNEDGINFTEVTGIPLKLEIDDSYKWFDIDSDGDQDILVLNKFRSKIYLNDSRGFLTEHTGILFPQVSFGSVEPGDYDGDGDLDIFFSGLRHATIPVTVLFRNKGNLQYEQDVLFNATGIGSGSLAPGDYDNDGDLDLALTGVGIEGPSSEIFRNDINISNPAPSAPAGTISSVLKSDVVLKWNPVRTDNTVFKTLSYNIQVGTTTGSYNVVSPLSSDNGFRRISAPGNAELDTTYRLNNLPFGTYYWKVQAIDNGLAGGPFSSEGSFDIVPVQAKNLTAKNMSPTSLSLNWERGNGDRCIVFCRQSTIGTASPLNNSGYIADSEFGFGQQLGTSGWFCVYNGRSDSVIVTGLLQNKNYIFHIFEYKGTFGNEQYFTQIADGNPGVFSTSSFSEQTDLPLNSYYDNTVDWGDYNNDGFIDLLIPGFPTRIYCNNGNNGFIEKTEISLTNVRDGSVSWGDYDNDGDLDIVLTGASVNSEPSSPVTKIFRNDGSDIFTEQAENQFINVYHSSTQWGDYDNDGDLDLLLTGATGPPDDLKPISKIFINYGNNTFLENTSIILVGILKGSAKWIDFDNDADLDIIISGAKGGYFNTGVTIIYRNDGNGLFSEKALLEHSGESYADLSCGDFDNDGDADIIRTRSGLVEIFQNLGNFKFIKHYEKGLASNSGSICYTSFADYNNDGYLDFILTNPYWDTRIYRNTLGTNPPNAETEWFQIEVINSLSSVGYSFANWADYDNDGDLDFVLALNNKPTRIFKNNLIMKSGRYSSNNSPAAPQVPNVTYDPAGIFLRWKPVISDMTDYKTMTYNVKIGNSTDNNNICPPHASSSGFRKLTGMGNAQLDTTFFLKNLPSGKYYWQVQAVDQSYAGGAWSEVSTFEVKTVQSFFSSDEVCHGLPTHFTDQSVATAGVVSWKWDFRDGTISTSQNPIHTYSASGTYNVKLVITDAGGTKDSLEQAVIVKPRPLTGFDAQSVCQGIPVTAANTTNNNGLTISSWRWDFGDTGAGNISYLQQPPPHPYLSPDDYTIKLKAIASNGCADSVSHDVSVGSYPVAAVTSSGPLSFCKGDSVTLTVPLNPGYTYRWRISGTDLTGATANTFKAKLSGNYTVEITNPKGSCRSTSPSVSVTAFDAPSAPLISLSGNTTFCEGDSVTLTIAPVAGNTYDWKLNGGSVGTGSSHSAKSSGIYSLVVSNASGCKANSTNTVALIVNPKPLLTSISSSGSTTFCDGESVGLSVTLNPGLTYSWRNENGPIPGADKNSFSALSSGSYRLDIGNSFGCSVRTLPVNVLVKERPAKPLLDSTNYVKGKCPGDNPIKLSVKEPSDRYEYTWYRDGFPLDHEATYIDVYESGYYQLTASLNGCTAESRVFNADFPAGPAKPLIYAQGPSLWYLASSVIDAAKYRWYYNGKLIEEADKYFYVANYKLGQYQVSIGDKDGCYTRSDIITIPPGYTGADDAEPFEGIRIYPNPSSGLVTIEIDNNIFGKLSLEIISPDGKRIKKSEIEKTGQHLLYQTDLTGQPEGIYIISLVLNNYRTTRKILIK